MNRLKLSSQQRKLRTRRVRAAIHGRTDRPRLSVHVSHKHVTAQLINDDTHSTISYVSTVGTKNDGKTMTDKAAWVGEQVAVAAKKAKVSKVVMDRGPKLYHGRVAALADAARAKGLEL